jgi:predicted acylesterase/phospholipase RssA/CRP-like cAMP-binding protein
MNQSRHSTKSQTTILLSSSKLFSQLAPALLESLASELKLVQLNGGDTLMRQGDPADCMYAVISGRLRAYITEEDGTITPIGEIAGGESVGEMAMITGEPRSANVQATRDTELIQFTREGFERLVARRPDTMMKITNEIVNRMEHLMQGAEGITPIKTIALIPTDVNVPLRKFARRLLRSLENHGPVLCLDRERFEQEHGEGSSLWESDTSVKNLSVASWLSSQETSYRFIIYVADPTASAWTKRCVRGADRVIFVGRSASSPTQGEIEQYISGTDSDGPRVETKLVLLHEDGKIFPESTQKWLEKRNAIRHYHVRVERADDYGRLGRLLARKGVGLVLGGGGSRGFAHIGVIRALEEAGIPIDAICGVSMGAILAAQYAMGHDTNAMLRMNRTGIADKHLNRDFTIPLVSITSGKKFRKSLQEFYGDTQIEDLWLNFFCVSCNLSTAETVIHREGALTRAVAASNAAPGIIPPILEDGNLLVDGGIVNNQPGDIMKQVCGGPVIVINVSPSTELTVETSYDEMPSPWRILGSRINPFRETISAPTITAMLMRTLMVGSHRKMQEVEQNADYYLRPPLSNSHLDDYTRIEEIVEVGYRYAKEQIATWSVLPGVQ